MNKLFKCNYCGHKFLYKDAKYDFVKSKDSCPHCASIDLVARVISKQSGNVFGYPTEDLSKVDLKDRSKDQSKELNKNSSEKTVEIDLNDWMGYD